jgi:hypothetical protein
MVCVALFLPVCDTRECGGRFIVFGEVLQKSGHMGRGFVNATVPRDRWMVA